MNSFTLGACSPALKFKNLFRSYKNRNHGHRELGGLIFWLLERIDFNTRILDASILVSQKKSIAKSTFLLLCLGWCRALNSAKNFALPFGFRQPHRQSYLRLRLSVNKTTSWTLPFVISQLNFSLVAYFLHLLLAQSPVLRFRDFNATCQGNYTALKLFRIFPMLNTISQWREAMLI